MAVGRISTRCEFQKSRGKGPHTARVVEHGQGEVPDRLLALSKAVEIAHAGECVRRVRGAQAERLLLVRQRLLG